MSVPRYVLDTNIFTDILPQDSTVTDRTAEALAAGAEFILCPVVFYEIYRGLLYRDSRKQLNFFLTYAATFRWDDLTHDDWWAAAQLWSDLRRQGVQVADADLLIGTYAAQRNASVVTGNEKHFAPLAMPVENWLR